jgi:hypothetical protein
MIPQGLNIGDRDWNPSLHSSLLVCMTLLLITLVAFALAVFLIKGRAKASTKFEASIETGVGIPMTEEEVELERESNKEILQLLEANIIASGFFRPDKIPELVAKLREGSIPFGRTNTKVVFDGDVILTVKEKKTLGLNTRMKYSKKFIEYFDPPALGRIEPKTALENMHLSAFHRVSRKRELLKLKKLGFVKEVEILPVGDESDCAEIKRFKKVHCIYEVPELPLPACDAPFCRCMYLAIIPRDI